MNTMMIGVDVGGTAIKFALIDKEGTILAKKQIATNSENDGIGIAEDIIAMIQEEFMSKLNTEDELIGIGIGVPGPISKDGETVIKAVNLGWHNLALKTIVEQKLARSVYLVNDANAAALGEMWRGAAVGVKDLVFVTLGTGVGGGIVVNGQLVNGAHSSGGEIGHIPIAAKEERICGCGNTNCLETFASATGLVNTMKKIAVRESLVCGTFSTVDIVEWARNGDSLAKEAIETTARYMGGALAGILNTIDVEEIVIGGGLAEAGAALLVPIKRYIDLAVFPEIRGKYRFAKAQLGNDAGVLGAVYPFSLR